MMPQKLIPFDLRIINHKRATIAPVRLWLAESSRVVKNSQRKRLDQTQLRSPANGIAKRFLSGTGLTYALFTLLFGVNVALGVALTMSPEISTLFGSQDRFAYQAYQERILQLRMEVDRLHSRQYLQTGNQNLQMQELLQQQQVLAEQYQYIRILAQKAEELGINTAPAEVQSLPPQATIEPVSVEVGQQREQTASLPELAAVSQGLNQMLDQSRIALSGISAAAEKSTGDIVNELGAVGISLDLPEASDLAMGGPLLAALPEQGNDGLAQDANHVLLALERFNYARTALTQAPIFHPLATARRISSAFGNRRDPFGGSSAFHSGLDIPATTGTPVYAAGMGKVIFSGRRNGYGILVEIEHANGLITRYAHMSANLVRTGETVNAGDLIGKVGSTGRSTGPHLHFEVRKDTKPVNPSNFLRIAQRLGGYLS